MKMTLREAVNVERMGRAAYAGKRWSRLAATPSLPMPYIDSKIEAEWSHVQSIVDAAIEAHEARCKHADNECLSDDFIRGWDEESKFKKLRAIEAGEEPK